MNDSVTHVWANGTIVSCESKREDGKPMVALKIQDETETMIADIVMGEQEAIAIAHAILSIVTRSFKEHDIN